MTISSSRSLSIALIAARVLFGLIFLAAGLFKLAGPDDGRGVRSARPWTRLPIRHRRHGGAWCSHARAPIQLQVWRSGAYDRLARRVRGAVERVASGYHPHPRLRICSRLDSLLLQIGPQIASARTARPTPKAACGRLPLLPAAAGLSGLDRKRLPQRASRGASWSRSVRHCGAASQVAASAPPPHTAAAPQYFHASMGRADHLVHP